MVEILQRAISLGGKRAAISTVAVSTVAGLFSQYLGTSPNTCDDTFNQLEYAAVSL